MSGKTKQPKKEQSRGAEVHEANPTVTMLDYEGSPVVTYSVAEKRAKPARGTS